jgi:hypothetical protein
MQTCVRSTKPIDPENYLYAEFKYHKGFGCTYYIQRNTNSNPIVEPQTQNPMPIINPFQENDSPLQEESAKKRTYSPIKRKRKPCQHCNKVFLGRKAQLFCNKDCAQIYWRLEYKKKKSGDNLLNAQSNKLKKKINKKDAISFDSVENKHLIHAIVDSYHKAKLITALCKSIAPEIDIKIVKL